MLCLAKFKAQSTVSKSSVVCWTVTRTRFSKLKRLKFGSAIVKLKQSLCHWLQSPNNSYRLSWRNFRCRYRLELTRAATRGSAHYLLRTFSEQDEFSMCLRIWQLKKWLRFCCIWALKHQKSHWLIITYSSRKQTWSALSLINLCQINPTLRSITTFWISTSSLSVWPQKASWKSSL